MNQQSSSYPVRQEREKRQKPNLETSPAKQSCALIPVSADSPYPPISAEQPNYNYARMLYQPLADAKSELSAINQYLYQSWVLRCRDPELSQLFSRIAQVQMHHFNGLGEMIVLLGGNPKFRAFHQNGFQFWNAGMLNYNESIPDLIRANIAAEKHAFTTYETLASIIHDPHISAVLLRYSLDEALHVKLLEAFGNQPH